MSSLGHDVTCIDIDVAKVALLSRGEVPIVEHGLPELVTAGLQNSTLSFTTDMSAVTTADLVFLCLPTPQGDDGEADVSYVEGVIRDIRSLLPSGAVVVNKSTVPVGTAKKLTVLLNRGDVAVVSNPEFLRQGTAVQDFLHPSRIVIGGVDTDAVNRVAGAYGGINAPVLLMNWESAEMLKYAANTFLATKLTFINAMADICELVGADINEIAQGLELDPRIGAGMLQAGPGWGGSCFPKDTRALLNVAGDKGYDFELLRGVIKTNDDHYRRVVTKVEVVCGGSVAGKKIAAWGLTFKANTDDLRDSPAIKILTMLHNNGAEIVANDPTARGSYSDYPWIEVADNALRACQNADALVVLTEWPQFVDVDPIDVGNVMKTRNVVDARNMLDRSKWIANGFTLIGVGR
jgi:UDPglucose 6-dehydrogenase